MEKLSDDTAGTAQPSDNGLMVETQTLQILDSDCEIVNDDEQQV